MLRHKIQNLVRGQNIFLLIIILIALLLRVWGADFDLPYISHPDEPHEVNRALRLGLGSFEFERIGKGGYFYLLFIEYGLFFVVLWLTGIVSSVKGFMLYFLQDASYFYLIGRVTTALIGTLTVWIVYKVGEKISGAVVGIVAATLLAFCSLSALHAHYITVDVPMSCGVIVTFYFALGILEKGDVKFYIWAGVFAALSIMTKLAAAPVLIVVLLAHIMHYVGREKGVTNVLLDRRFLLCGIVVLCIYLLGNPGFVVARSKVVEVINRLFFAKGNNYNPVYTAELQNLWLYYFEVSKKALGWPGLALALAGVGYALHQRGKNELLLLAFPVLLYIAISATSAGYLRNPRYILPSLPFFFILSAMFLVETLDRMKVPSMWKGVVITIVVVAVCAPRIQTIIKQNQFFSRPGTPILAKDWVEGNICDGSKILMPGYPGGPSERRICPLQDNAANMRKWANRLENESPMGAMYVRKQASIQQSKAYDLVVINLRSDWMTWDETKNSNIQYVIISLEHFKNDRLTFSSRRLSDRLRSSRLDFYSAMVNDPEARLLKTIYPTGAIDDDATPRGSHIEIYEISTDL